MKKVNQELYVKALKWIVRLLEKNKIKYAVLGGLAAYAYGSKRMLVDIDFSMSYKNMKKLAKITEKSVVEMPWNGVSSTGLWKGYYMELNYHGIRIEVGETTNTKFFNKKTNQWEKFPDALKNAVTKKIFGLTLPVMPKKSLIAYKSKLKRKVDLLDLKSLCS